MGRRENWGSLAVQNPAERASQISQRGGKLQPAGKRNDSVNVLWVCFVGVWAVLA